MGTLATRHKMLGYEIRCAGITKFKADGIAPRAEMLRQGMRVCADEKADVKVVIFMERPDGHKYDNPAIGYRWNETHQRPMEINPCW